MRKHMEWVVFTGTFRQVVNLNYCTCSAHSYKETPARRYPWVELFPQRYLAVIIIGQYNTQIIFSMKIHGISPRSNGSATTVFQSGWAGMNTMKTRKNVILSPSCHAHHGRDFLENKTQKELHNRPTEQRTQDWTYSLDDGQPQTESALWVMGYKQDLFLWWDVKTCQTMRMLPVSLHSLSCRQVHKGIRKIRQFVSVFLPSLWNSYSSQSNRQ